MPEYIECPLEECTHARLPNGEVVGCFGECATEPYLSDKRILVGDPECVSEVFWTVWPDLGITPVKERPRPEPVTVETVVRAFDIDNHCALGIDHELSKSFGFSAGDRVRVTVEKIEEGE